MACATAPIDFAGRWELFPKPDRLRGAPGRIGAALCWTTHEIVQSDP
ncbi:hypothetical protein HMPREF9061_00752 [Actinomyces sp. oral taxon 181 str. F0379]|nr:hypothetical protein HMPREF9061_00752 [Actinomyces sp. oral taxon 181 str. F0379]